jgi:hypothetical protein
MRPGGRAGTPPMKRRPCRLAPLSLLAGLAGAAPALAAPPRTFAAPAQGAPLRESNALAEGRPDLTELRDGPRGPAEPPGPLLGAPPEGRAPTAIAGPSDASAALPLPGLAHGLDAKRSPKATKAAAIAQANYLIAASGTTLLYQAAQKPLAGPQGDVSPEIGYGRFLTDSFALEFLASASFGGGNPTSLSLAPGGMWMLSESVYTGGWAVVSVRPKVDVALAAGIGGMLSISDRIAAFAEADLISALSHGSPDAALGVMAGAFYSF